MRRVIGLLVASVLAPTALSACRGDNPSGGPGSPMASPDYPSGGAYATGAGVNSDRAARFELNHPAPSQAARGGGPVITDHPGSAQTPPESAPMDDANRNARGSVPGSNPGSTQTNGSPAIAPPSTSTAWDDPQVAATLAAVDTAEVKAGNLAVRMAHAASVRSFARMMVQHHTMDDRRARGMFARVHIDPMPNAAVERMTAESDRSVNQLSGLQGDAFDRAYMHAQVQNHQEVLSMIDQTLLPNAHQGDLRTAIQQEVRPMVQSHLAHARQIEARLLGTPTPAGAMDHPMDHPMNHTMDHPMNHTMDHPMNHTMDHPMAPTTGAQGNVPAQAQQRP